MTRIRKGTACLLAAALLPIFSACTGDKGMPTAERPALRGVTVAKVEAAMIPVRYEASGTVRASNSATLSARISGTVAKLLVKEGDLVRRGALLATLEAMESTAAASGAAQAVEEALARKRLADVTFERYSRLYEEEAVTRQELDTRRAEKDMADRALARARENARAAVAVAGYTRIVAPLNGIVTARSVDAGATVFPGTPLLTVEEVGRYRLEVNAPESLLGKIRVGGEATVSLDGGGGIFKAGISEIVPKVDPVSRTFIVKIDIPSMGVRSGQFGRAFFPVGEKEGIAVPRAAVVERGQLFFVWAVDAQKIVRMRLVKPGEAYGDRVEILAGLSAGDRIVVGGMEKVVDGAIIE